MIFVGLIIFWVYCLRQANKAVAQMEEASRHEAAFDPAKAGHDIASDWVRRCEAAVETWRERIDWCDNVFTWVGLFAVIGGVTLGLIRVAAAGAAAAAAAAAEPAAAGWAVVVDGIDTMLWIILAI